MSDGRTERRGFHLNAQRHHFEPEVPGTPSTLKNRYQLKERLGEGGFAVTWKAWDLQAGRDCVVKEVHLRRIDDEKSLELFEREAERVHARVAGGAGLQLVEHELAALRDEAQAVETPIGYVPAPGSIDLHGIEKEVSPEVLASLLAIDPHDWSEEMQSQAEFFQRFGDRMPEEIWRQHRTTAKRLGL